MLQQNGAPENIDAIKNAFQVLIHEERRNMYDRFGDIQSHVVGEAHLPVIATALAIAYHALSSIICFALYRSSQLALTRYLMFMYSAISFALEMECRFVGSSSVFKGVFYLNQLLPYQQVQLLRGLAPAIALLLNMICAYFFVDLERLSYFLWHSSVSTNRVILEKMADVVDATNYVKSMSSPSTAHMKVSAGSTEMPHVQSKKDGQQDAGTLNAQSSSSQQLLNLIESLDETQRQKMMDVLKRSTDADTKEDEEQGGWFNTVKSTAIYLAIFFLIKYYWK
ncbi:DNAJ-like molecular chaperone [Babesia ovis]|uniref:DNAJ-like molecular chaperone n=1 Tax=Babesia ovis TaxID=5869 RepID=A0A9W5WW48_BABOV|nr:DNAJ-like molecular chaperone [Babesia ovis]